jgi:hypothetical protein
MPVQHVVLSAATGAAIPVLGNGAAISRIQVVVVSKDNVALQYGTLYPTREGLHHLCPCVLRHHE